MNKLNEPGTSPTPTDIGNEDNPEEKYLENEEAKEAANPRTAEEATEEKVTIAEGEETNVLKFTMLFNKYNSMLDMKRRGDDDKRDKKYAMFFNKEVTIRPTPEPPATKLPEAKNPALLNPRRSHILRANRTKSKLNPQNLPDPQINEPGKMFCNSLFSSLSDVCDRQTQPKPEMMNRFINKRNMRVDDALVQFIVHPTPQTDLRNRSSMTSLAKNNKYRTIKSKVPSLTALDVTAVQPKGCYWEHSDDLILMQSDVEKRLNLQISRSSNDNNRRPLLKFKKEDAASVSDSKLLYTDSESKRHFKKCDKKSRGDSSRKERCCGSRKQVQWKTEVDVIYFSTHMAANGDRTGEVIGRVMEPLREEWEQQRKGFYAKVVPSYMESHVKDHFISLLKI